MKNRATYTKPTLVEYGSVYGVTKGHLKEFGAGDGLFFQTSDGDVPIKFVGSSFH